MEMAAGVQPIVQTEQSDRAYECLGFTGLPIVNPVVVALHSASTPRDRANLAILQPALAAEIRTLAPAITAVVLPCDGAFWLAHEETDCRKLLILIGDDTTLAKFLL